VVTESKWEKNGDSLNSVGCEVCRHFRNKKREYLKDKSKEHATNSKNKNTNMRDLYRGINEFESDYQLVCNLMKNEIDDLLTDSHNILGGWKNYFD
jgi:hypothetical protein